jgi:hypothetical protein
MISLNLGQYKRVITFGGNAPKGTLSVSCVLKGIEYLLEGYLLPGLLVQGLPHNTVSLPGRGKPRVSLEL